MVDEVIHYLNPKKGGVYVDATFGMGGHTLSIIEAQPDLELIIAVDLDADSIKRALSVIGEDPKKIHIYQGNFTQVPLFLEKEGITQVDGIIMDLGISSYHYEESGRGFSFKRDEPLDMRLNLNSKFSAYDIINNLSEDKIEEIIRLYGEESWSKKIANTIVEKRKQKKIETSKELADIIYHTIPRKFHPRHIHPATKTFQALRIAVNSELDNLKLALQTFPELLKPKGRICIISFHSLEDRLVKEGFKQNEKLEIITKKPITPQESEINRNPKARSAKLRVAQRKEVMI